MLERSVQHYIRWLELACAVCRHIKIVDEGVVFLKPVSELLRRVNFPAIYEPHHLLLGRIQPQLLTLLNAPQVQNLLHKPLHGGLIWPVILQVGQIPPLPDSFPGFNMLWYHHCGLPLENELQWKHATTGSWADHPRYLPLLVLS